MQLRRDEMAGSGYATNSRRKILDFLKSNSDRTVTAADIDQYLKRNGDAVNITTIYRYLDKLATDGTVMKYVAEAGGKAVYQYVELGQHCDEHLHVKCVCLLYTSYCLPCMMHTFANHSFLQPACICNSFAFCIIH